MPRRSDTVTDTELELLKLLWDKGEASAKEVAQLRYGQAEESEIGTVHSLLLRLEKKGLVRRDRSSQPHLFSAAISQIELAGRQLEQMADKLADGSMAPFITHLVHSNRLTPQELQEIRELLAASPKQKRRS